MIINKKYTSIGKVKVVVQRSSTVQLPRAEPGGKRNIIMWTERQGTN